MRSKLLGGILLVIGTTIGAGMLALPVATAQIGFWGASALLVMCWLVMLVCSYLFLEVNMWLPANTNLISMAGATLGKTGQALAWIVYSVMLYSIISAYVAGGGDLFHYILHTIGVDIPASGGSMLFVLIFGTVVCFGIRMVDYVNRGLMFGKLGALVLLIAMILPFVGAEHVNRGEIVHVTSANSISVAIVSFGSLMIIPSLRTYFDGDVKSLRTAIFVGTFIPLICYIAWNLVILGVVPYAGAHGLQSMATSGSSNSDLLATIDSLLHKEIITSIAKFFTSICMATSFLSISLSLSDFLADGFGVAKKGLGAVAVFAATFCPPLGFVLFYPNAFIKALNYAGLACFVLMILLPPLMVWFGRYHRAIAQGYEVRGGKILLAVLMIFATLMIGMGIEGAV